MRSQNIDLFIAIKTNNVYNVIDTIKKFGFHDDYFNGKMTFLSLAIFQGNIDIVRVLLNAGASINLLSHISHIWPYIQLFETFEPAIVTAARLGKFEICEELIKNNVNINKPDSYQMTALHWASELGYLKIVELLVDNRALIDLLDSKNQTPLEKCIYKNQQQVLKYYLENVNYKKNFYQLMLAATQIFNYDIIEMLLNECQNGKIDFDINNIDNAVGSMLHYAVILSNINDTSKSIQNENYLKSIDTLIKGGCKVNLVNKLGETPLHLCRNCSVVDLLLSYGAHLDVKEITGKTPLFTYFCHANYDMCIELLKHGCELEIIDRLGNSLLYSVIHSNAPIKFIILLLQAGVCLNKEKWLIERIFPARLRNRYPKLISFIEWRARNPLSLKELCRKSIRNYLNQINKNRSMLKQVLHLPVPNVLQDYILFNLK